MNRSEFSAVVNRVAAIEPAYLRWMEEESNKISGVRGCSPDEAYDAMKAEWLRALEPYSLAEISNVLDQIASTHKALPSYSKLWREVALYAGEDRRASRQSAVYARDGEKQFECLDCRDTGIVEIWNPDFIAWFQLGPFLEWEDAGWPPYWIRVARQAWHAVLPPKAPETSPARGDSLWISALCDCHCNRRRKLWEERQKFYDGGRKTAKGDALYLPACGAAILDRKGMYFVTTRFPTPNDVREMFGFARRPEEDAALEEFIRGREIPLKLKTI